MSYIDPRDTTDRFYGTASPEGTDWLTPGEPSYVADQDTRAPYTPMGLDIFAAQRLYGAPTNGVLSGGQIFGFNCNIMYTDTDGTQKPLSMWDFDTSADGSTDMAPVVTPDHYGTNNTLDLSGFTLPSTVHLISGQWTSADGMINNIFIEDAPRSTPRSAAPATTFWLNADGDTINGGAGNNTAIVFGARTAFTIGGTPDATTYTDTDTGAVNTFSNGRTSVRVGQLDRQRGEQQLQQHHQLEHGQPAGGHGRYRGRRRRDCNYSGDQTQTVDSVQVDQFGTLQIDEGHFIITDAAQNRRTPARSTSTPPAPRSVCTSVARW